MSEHDIGCVRCHLKIRGPRGLCVSCLSLLQKLVKKGKVTWSELEARDECNPPRRQSERTKKWTNPVNTPLTQNDRY